MTEGFKVEHVDWHRNGISGQGFYVAIVDDPEGGRMLVIDFGSDDEECDEHRNCVAVLNIDKAAEGNIYMHPQAGVDNSGGNAWRGDRIGAEYIPSIRAKQDEKWDALMRPQVSEHERLSRMFEQAAQDERTSEELHRHTTKGKR